MSEAPVSRLNRPWDGGWNDPPPTALATAEKLKDRESVVKKQLRPGIRHYPTNPVISGGYVPQMPVAPQQPIETQQPAFVPSGPAYDTGHSNFYSSQPGFDAAQPGVSPTITPSYGNQQYNNSNTHDKPPDTTNSPWSITEYLRKGIENFDIDTITNSISSLTEKIGGYSYSMPQQQQPRSNTNGYQDNLFSPNMGGSYNSQMSYGEYPSTQQSYDPYARYCGPAEPAPPPSGAGLNLMSIKTEAGSKPRPQAIPQNLFYQPNLYESNVVMPEPKLPTEDTNFQQYQNVPVSSQQSAYQASLGALPNIPTGMPTMVQLQQQNFNQSWAPQSFQPPDVSSSLPLQQFSNQPASHQQDAASAPWQQGCVTKQDPSQLWQYQHTGYSSWQQQQQQVSEATWQQQQPPTSLPHQQQLGPAPWQQQQQQQQKEQEQTMPVPLQHAESNSVQNQVAQESVDSFKLVEEQRSDQGSVEQDRETIKEGQSLSESYPANHLTSTAVDSTSVETSSVSNSKADEKSEQKLTNTCSADVKTDEKQSLEPKLSTPDEILASFQPNVVPELSVSSTNSFDMASLSQSMPVSESFVPVTSATTLETSQVTELPNSPPTLPVESYGGVSIFKPEVVETASESVDSSDRLGSEWDNDFENWGNELKENKDFEDIQL